MAITQLVIATALWGALSSAAILDLPIIVDNSYKVVELDVGTPAKTYRLLFDTGSASSWIVDDGCAITCPDSTDYDRVGYNVDGSATGHLTGQYGEIDYLGGSTGGPVVSDLFKLGAVSWNQSFLAANETSWFNIPADGFLGLAFNTITVGGADTVVETLFPELDNPRFAIYYGHEETNTNGSGEGLLTIGGSHEEKYSEGELVRVPLVLRSQDEGYQVWRTSIQGMTASFSGGTNGSASTITTSFDPGYAVFDTGAGQIVLPQDKNDAVYESLGWNYTAVVSGERVLLCSEFNSTWSVSFTFGDGTADNTQILSLRGDQLARPGFPAAPDACWPPFEQGDTDGFTLIGTPLLSQFYTIWDFGAKDVSEYKPSVSFGILKA